MSMNKHLCLGLNVFAKFTNFMILCDVLAKLWIYKFKILHDFLSTGSANPDISLDKTWPNKNKQNYCANYRTLFEEFLVLFLFLFFYKIHFQSLSTTFHDHLIKIHDFSD